MKAFRVSLGEGDEHKGWNGNLRTGMEALVVFLDGRYPGLELLTLVMRESLHSVGFRKIYTTYTQVSRRISAF